jgi:hypothetical protein
VKREDLETFAANGQEVVFDIGLYRWPVEAQRLRWTGNRKTRKMLL